ncbi:GGDEF domain-containing protein [Piscinibacter sp. Jin2]|uniref:GGDEF domain-containing protein n=1 Tax=Aquariibacter lacus TaxID=2801332 RepID=A0A9X0XFZ7_9BURK|nr:GGDEF domain-containing protein [Piscinibacter lacus]MBL0720891.1 GGDEF domain-containing protein [Piscinibacter lacus]
MHLPLPQDPRPLALHGLPPTTRIPSVRRNGSLALPPEDRVLDDGRALLRQTRRALRLAMHTPMTSSLAAEHLSLRNGLITCLGALDRLQLLLALESVRQRQQARGREQGRAELAQTQAHLARLDQDAQQARHQALHDSLTGLPNRRQFEERLVEALAEPAEAVRRARGLLYLDLDGFKAINDRHGHAVGDSVLRVIARRLAATVRSEDLMSRVGGDEFACLLRRLDRPERLQVLGHKLVEAVGQPIQLGGLTLQLGASVGGLRLEPTSRDANALLRAADRAMYRAKRDGGGLALFDAERDGPIA